MGRLLFCTPSRRLVTRTTCVAKTLESLASLSRRRSPRAPDTSRRGASTSRTVCRRMCFWEKARASQSTLRVLLLSSSWRTPSPSMMVVLPCCCCGGQPLCRCRDEKRYIQKSQRSSSLPCGVEKKNPILYSLSTLSLSLEKNKSRRRRQQNYYRSVVVSRRINTPPRPTHQARLLVVVVVPTRLMRCNRERMTPKTPL